MKNRDRISVYAIIGLSLISFGIYSSTMNYADAVVLSSRTYHTAMGQVAAFAFQQKNYIAIVSASNPPNELVVIRADTLAGVANITLPVQPAQFGSNHADTIGCKVTTSFGDWCVISRPVDANEFGLLFQEIGGGNDFVIYTNTTFDDCAMFGMTTIGGSVYGAVGGNGGQACGQSGIWKINIEAAVDGDATNQASIITRPADLIGIVTADSNVRWTESCYDSITDQIVWVDGISTTMLRIEVSSLTQEPSIELSSISTDVWCGGGFAVTASTNAIKVVNLSTGGVVTTAVATAPHTVIKHGDSVYSKDSEAAMKIYTFSATSSMTQSGTITGMDAAFGKILKGNSTRFNVVQTNEKAFALNGLPDSGEDDDEVSEFCQIPANANLLRCRLENQQDTPLGSASQNIQNSTFDILVQIGLLDGSNEDCATNGVGYILVAVALGIEAGLFYVGTRGDLRSIPAFVWIISTLVIIGLISAFGCLEAQWFIIAVVSVIALGALKIKGVF